jgi:iron complex outermembrane recepter protein
MPELSRLYCRGTVIPQIVLASVVWGLSPAQAQTAPAQPTPATTGTQTAATDAAKSQGVEEVTVTAERRSTNIQKTPLAISVLSQDALDKSNVTSIADINGKVPGLEITKSSGFETMVTIRGIGSETPENAPITVPGVSLFVDDVYIANTISLDQTLFDLNHMEVLRGPQGALYGESSIGGAINLVSNQPELGEYGGSGDVTLGDYNLHRERAEINVPIGDTIAVRGSVQKDDHDGFTKDTSFPDYYLDDQDDVSGKLAVLWKPSSTFKATLTGQWYSADQNGAAQKNINDPNSDPYTVTQDFPSKFNLDTQLYHLNMQWDLPWFSIKSVTAYQDLDHRQKEDSSRSAFSVLGSYDDIAAWNTTLKSYSQEFDLLSSPDSKLNWITGVFLMQQRSTQFVAEFEGTDPDPVTTLTPDIETNPPANLAYGNYTSTFRQSYSPFFQGTYPILDNLRFTLGGRWNYDSYHLSGLNFSAFSISNVKHDFSGNQPTGRAELDYDLTPDNMLYASLSRGYKPGGVNGISGAVVIPNAFKAETNTAYEVGLKNELFDHSLRLNLAGFFYNYKNMQYIETDPVPFDGGISNIPSIHVWGIEAEAAYVGLQNHLHVNANLAVEQGSVQGTYKTIDSTVQQRIESTNAACLFGGAYYNPACWSAVIASAKNISGNTPADMPDVSGSIDASYDFTIPTGVLTPRLEFIYRGNFESRIFNEAALDHVGAYGLLNFNLQYQPTNSNFTLSLTATNLTNEAGVNSRYTDPYGTGQTSQQYIAPRQVMATVAYQF